MLSATTRSAIGLLDVLTSPEQLPDLTMYVHEATLLIPRGSELQAEVEEAYLKTARALCYARSTDQNQRFLAITHLEDVVKGGTVPGRLKMLAWFYQSVLRLAYPTKDPNEILLPPGDVLTTLEDHFSNVAALASNIREYGIAGTCWSLAAECTLRSGGDQAQALWVAGMANMAFLHFMPLDSPRVTARSAATEAILASGATAPPPLMDFSTLLYEPGELLAA